MSALLQPPEPIFSPKKRRVEPIFTAEERSIFEPYKELYRSSTTPQARTAILKDKILTDIFNYWATKGTEPKTGEEWAERIKKVVQYIKNCWRPYYQHKDPKVLLKTSLRDVVRQTMAKEINEEIQNLLRGKDHNASGLDAFAQYNVAVKNVMHQLTPQEESRLRKMAAEWSEKGNPPEIQRKKARKHGLKRVDDADVLRFREMGMLSWTVVGWYADEGMTIRIHDNMSYLTHANRPTFQDSFPDLVSDLNKKMMDYMSALLGRDMPSNMQSPHDLTPPILTRHDLILDLDRDGFPILPADPGPNIFQTRAELEMLVRDYLNTHYKIASGYRYESAPYKAVRTNDQQFIHSRYLPEGLIFQDPHNLGRPELLRLLNFWRDRQGQYGSGDTFRWTVYLNRHKQPVAAEYGTRADREKNAAAAAARKATRKNGGKNRKQRPTPSAVVDGNSRTIANDGAADGGSALVTGSAVVDGNSRTIANDGAADGGSALVTGSAANLEWQRGPTLPLSPSVPHTPLPDLQEEPPVLRSPHTPQPQRHNRSTVHNESRPNVSASAHDESALDESVHDGCVDDTAVVDATTIHLLQQRGWSHPDPPINGPSDGSPRYRVSRRVLDILQDEDNDQFEGEGRPALQNQKKRKALPNQLSTNSKRPRKSQAQMLQEDAARYIDMSTPAKRSSSRTKVIRPVRRH